MRPVPAWVSQVALPLHGEAYTDHWGPLSTPVHEVTVSGTLVLSNYRLLFIRGRGPALSNVQVELSIPLESVERTIAEQRDVEGRVIVNRTAYSFHAATPAAAGEVAASIAGAIIDARGSRLSSLARPPDPPPARVHVVHREVIREIVKVPCRHCGSLVEVTARNCASCGAALR